MAKGRLKGTLSYSCQTCPGEPCAFTSAGISRKTRGVRGKTELRKPTKAGTAATLKSTDTAPRKRKRNGVIQRSRKEKGDSGID